MRMLELLRVSSTSDTTGTEVLRFDLERNSSVETALVVCEIYETAANGSLMLLVPVIRAVCTHFARASALMCND